MDSGTEKERRVYSLFRLTSIIKISFESKDIFTIPMEYFSHERIVDGIITDRPDVLRVLISLNTSINT